jgi:hypothetical protein
MLLIPLLCERSAVLLQCDRLTSSSPSCTLLAFAGASVNCGVVCCFGHASTPEIAQADSLSDGAQVGAQVDIAFWRFDTKGRSALDSPAATKNLKLLPHCALDLHLHCAMRPHMIDSAETPIDASASIDNPDSRSRAASRRAEQDALRKSYCHKRCCQMWYAKLSTSLACFSNAAEKTRVATCTEHSGGKQQTSAS